MIRVEVTSPPINDIARGLKKLPPVSHNGISPKIVVMLVNIIGLKRKYTASIQAFLTSLPLL